MKAVGVVVLYYPSNDNIKNIINYSRLFEKLIVVDNTPNRNDNSINSNIIEYFPLNCNFGLGYALNFGLKKLISDGYQYAMTLDQDSILTESNFDTYFNFITRFKDVALISPFYIFDRNKTKKSDTEYVYETLTMQSASVFNLKILSSLNFFDENLFIDCIDYDYCLKAIKHGYKIITYNKYELIHSPGITKESKIFKKKYGYCSPLRIYYQSRNIRVLIKRYSYKKLYIHLWWKLFKIYFYFENKKEFLRMYKKGKDDFKQNKLGVYNK